MWHFEAKYFNWMAEENKTIHIEVNDYGQEVSELDMWILAVEKAATYATGTWSLDSVQFIGC